MDVWMNGCLGVWMEDWWEWMDVSPRIACGCQMGLSCGRSSPAS